MGKGVLPNLISWNTDEIARDVNLNNFWFIPLRELIADASAGRKYELIRSLLLDLSRVEVNRGVPGLWELNTRLLGDIIFLNSEQGSGGKRTLVGWSFTPALEPYLLNPNRFTPISLYYQSMLSTEAALVLYEIGRKYETWKFHRTKKLKWQEWQEILITNQTLRAAYKDFHRDIIKPALAEINLKTDIHLTMFEEKKPGSARAVDELQFFVESKQQQNFELPSEAPLNMGMLDSLEATGIASGAALKLLNQHGEEKIGAALAVLEKRQANSSLPVLDFPAAYFKSALAGDYAAVGIAEKKKMAKEKTAGEESARARIAALTKLTTDAAIADAGKQSDAIKARAVAKAAHDALTGDEQAAMVSEFLDQLALPLAKRARATLQGKTWVTGDLDAKLYLAWLAKRLSL